MQSAHSTGRLKMIAIFENRLRNFLGFESLKTVGPLVRQPRIPRRWLRIRHLFIGPAEQNLKGFPMLVDCLWRVTSLTRLLVEQLFQRSVIRTQHERQLVLEES